MSQLVETFQAVSAMIDDGQVDTDLLGDMDLGEVQTILASVVSAQLTQLDPGDDADLNEQNLRQMIETAALKAFFAGLALGPTSPSETPAGGLVLPLSADNLAALVTHVVRTGQLALTLQVDESA